jgi:hypothetical protein
MNTVVALVSLYVVFDLAYTLFHRGLHHRRYLEQHYIMISASEVRCNVFCRGY